MLDADRDKRDWEITPNPVEKAFDLSMPDPDESEWDIDSALAQVGNIAGLRRAALVDQNYGICLRRTDADEEHGWDDDRLDAAATGNSAMIELVHTLIARLSNDRIQDICIALRDELHLIRPVARTMFLYMVLDRAESSLPLARRRLEALGETIDECKVRLHTVIPIDVPQALAPAPIVTAPAPIVTAPAPIVTAPAPIVTAPAPTVPTAVPLTVTPFPGAFPRPIPVSETPVAMTRATEPSPAASVSAPTVEDEDEDENLPPFMRLGSVMRMLGLRPIGSDSSVRARAT